MTKSPINLSKALDRIKEGRIVTRPIWNSITLKLNTETRLIEYIFDGTISSLWFPNPDDLIANDYILLD